MNLARRTLLGLALGLPFALAQLKPREEEPDDFCMVQSSP